ncbi:MAG: hypothetical protein QXZ09_10060, partial [Candidatus Methanomethylicaceae archaeon]
MSSNSQASTPTEQAKRRYRSAEEAAKAIATSLGLTKPPTHAYKYHDENGQLCGMVLRWDLDSGKVIRPIRRLPDDSWTLEAMPAPRPLYRLPELLQTPRDDARYTIVFIVEGEKCV